MQVASFVVSVSEKCGAGWVKHAYSAFMTICIVCIVYVLGPNLFLSLEKQKDVSCDLNLLMTPSPRTTYCGKGPSCEPLLWLG